MTSDSVPFGKYKGRPVEDMLADADYMRWLEAQPWFRERFQHLMAKRDGDAMSRTPVHNRLQALFLDWRYRAAFVRVAAPGKIVEGVKWVQAASADAVGSAKAKASHARERAIDRRSAAEACLAKHLRKEPFTGWRATSWMEEAERRREEAAALDLEADAWDDESELQRRSTVTLVSRAQFEVRGVDVELNVQIRGNSLADRWDVDKFSRSSNFTCLDLSVEIKPTVADDYPAVLRQMKRHESRYLFTERYEGEGATEAQFVEMFRQSGRVVVFKRDVDAEANRIAASDEQAIYL